MKKFFRDNGILLLLAALLLSLIISISGQITGTDPFSAVVNTVVTPVRSGISYVIHWAEGLYDYIFRYEDMEQQVSDLRRQVARLEDQVRRGQEASRENEQLRMLLLPKI